MSASVVPVHNYYYERGLSLLEVVFATAIIMLLLVTLVSGATVSVRNATIARNEARASKYAREQMELVRAYRDRAGYASLSCAPAATCYINTWGSWTLLSGAPDPTLSGTGFTRWFSISSPTPASCDGGNGKYVVVTVTWKQGAITHYSTEETCFTNWQSS